MALSEAAREAAAAEHGAMRPGADPEAECGANKGGEAGENRDLALAGRERHDVAHAAVKADDAAGEAEAVLPDADPEADLGADPEAECANKGGAKKNRGLALAGHHHERPACHAAVRADDADGAALLPQPEHEPDAEWAVEAGSSCGKAVLPEAESQAGEVGGRVAGPAVGGPQGQQGEDDLQSGAVCRICLEGDAAHDLFAPCECAGSIELVHRSCLEQWRATSRSAATKCGTCGARFRFTSRWPGPWPGVVAAHVLDAAALGSLGLVLVLVQDWPALYGALHWTAVGVGLAIYPCLMCMWAVDGLDPARDGFLVACVHAPAVLNVVRAVLAAGGGDQGGVLGSFEPTSLAAAVLLLGYSLSLAAFAVTAVGFVCEARAAMREEVQGMWLMWLQSKPIQCARRERAVNS